MTGILPRDAAHYETVEIASTQPAAVVIARGHLDGDPAVSVVTRYELQPCDPGVRVRTELFNGGTSIWAMDLASASTC